MREWRKATGVSQADLAAKIGVKAASVCEWETEKKAPADTNLLAIEIATNGAVPVEAWKIDPKFAQGMRDLVERRHVAAEQAAQDRVAHTANDFAKPTGT